MTRSLDTWVSRERLRLEHARAQVTTLSPAATLARGYAVVQHLDGRIVRTPSDAVVGDRLRVRIAEGEIAAVVAEPDA